MTSVSFETVVANLQRPGLEVEYLQNENEMFGQALGINKYTESSYGQYSMQLKY